MFNSKSLFAAALALVSASSASAAAAEWKYSAQLNFTNNCPIPTPLYLAGQFVANLTSPTTDPANSFHVATYDNNDAAYFYTTAHCGGRDTQTGENTTRIAFFEDRYWLVKYPERIPLGITVVPDHVEYDGYCATIDCEDQACDDATAYPEPPPAKRSVDRRAEFTPPLFSCPEATKFTVTFCPDGTVPDNTDY